jgi:hypothetical protein
VIGAQKEILDLKPTVPDHRETPPLTAHRRLIAGNAVEARGDGGYGYLPYDYADRHIYDSWVYDMSRANLPKDTRGHLLPVAVPVI